MRSGAYAELWGVVDGAVADAFNNHPDYLTPKGQQSARTSVVKRVTGTVLSFAVQAAKGRATNPAETQERGSPSAHAGEGDTTSSPNPHCRIGRVIMKPRPRARCECGRFCKQDKPDITDKLVRDMAAAGLYVPPRFALRRQGGER